MEKIEHIWRLNGMKIILDLQGLPDRISDPMKKVQKSLWLTMQQKIHLIDNIHKNYLTEKNKPVNYRSCGPEE